MEKLLSFPNGACLGSCQLYSKLLKEGYLGSTGEYYWAYLATRSLDYGSCVRLVEGVHSG